ncbi:MAG: DEAD/DEAH box helicase family protein [Planctomycetota bacterium]
MSLGLAFDDGTLAITDPGPAAELLAPWCVYDQRAALWRARAMDYAPILRALHAAGVAYDDAARRYGELTLSERSPLAARDYQAEALSAWEGARRRGVVVLPTGAGKTYVALRAILAARRSALILAPTIDLVCQWAEELERRLGVAIGRYGGGDKILEEITVATYDSAILFMRYHGNRFGLLICDECHHLPAPVAAGAAEQAIAPFRLGLTATPERIDGMHARLDELLGPEVYHRAIPELEGRYLSAYRTELVKVALDEDEAERYAEHRAVYIGFIRRCGIDFSRPDGWQSFLRAAARDPEGRTALAAYREQKRIARASRGKLRTVWDLLRTHAGERCIVFTDDNATAYVIGTWMVLPVLTHRTRASERKWMLAAFRGGELPVLVTSRVLNEGVDVPEASVGIVVSGTGSTREHVQRLGRILRPRDGKVAVLYELISQSTGEESTSERRRAHLAFE